MLQIFHECKTTKKLSLHAFDISTQWARHFV
uniref:Uncharacterized protein n=1 Tax=Arundo donax TaxID=35708 RepID=A0A0A9C7A6_ARUDO